MASIDFFEAYDTFVKSHQKVWSHDRSKSVGASEAFGCIRKTWFAKNGAPKNKDHVDNWGALQRGDLIEQHFAEPAVKWFLETYYYDTRLIWGGDNQKTLVCPDAPLTATPDGLVIDADDDALELYGIPSLGGTGCFNFEIKSIDPRVNLKEEKSIHRGQTIVQMGITRETTEYTPNYAVIVYIDASFFSDIDIFVVPFDQEYYDVAKQRARSVYATKDVTKFIAEGKISGGCDYCPFTEECARVSGQAISKLKVDANGENTTSALMKEFEVLIRAERAASAARKSLEADYKEASERLKQWFSDVGVKRAEIPGVAKVAISWIKGRKSYDIEAMRAAGIDVDAFTKEGEGHSRLNISEKGPQTADET